jgi:xanthine phosphoribosyltransferase
MEILKNRILKDAEIVSAQYLKVDTFLNNQIDPSLIEEIASEFTARFSDTSFNKILTIESSGIAPAVMTGLKLGIPVVFAKKNEPSAIIKDAYTEMVHLWTKKCDYKISVPSKFIKKGERILIIDDFLANGSVSHALISITEQGGSRVGGVGIVIEKGFQDGGKILREMGYRVESLVIIENLENKKINFRE